MCLTGDDEDALDEVECPDLSTNGDDALGRAEPSGRNAKFWEALLKEKHEQLLKEEEHWQTNHLHPVDISPALDPAGMMTGTIFLVCRCQAAALRRRQAAWYCTRRLTF